MKKIFLLLAALTGFAACGFSATVVPGFYETVDGDDQVGEVLGSYDPVTPNIFAAVIQFVIHSDNLTALVGQDISGMAFRLDAVEAPDLPEFSFADYDIQFSSSVNGLNLSETFDDNIGADVVLVRSGSLTFGAGDFPTGGNPNGFGPAIVFSSNFAYVGGHLLVTIRHSEAVPIDPEDFETFYSTDAYNAEAFHGELGEYTRISLGDKDATTGIDFDAVPVVELTTVPEPGAVSLAVFGMVVLLARRGSRRKI